MKCVNDYYCVEVRKGAERRKSQHRLFVFELLIWLVPHKGYKRLLCEKELKAGKKQEEISIHFFQTGCYLFVTLHDSVPRVWPHDCSSMCVDLQIGRKGMRSLVTRTHWRLRGPEVFGS